MKNNFQGITLGPDFEDGYHLQARKRTSATPGRCRAYTVCGEQCILRSDVPHTLHLCKRADCTACHRDQYEAKK